MQEILLKIYGSVQGVNFRYDTARKAAQLSLTGWVKNEPDGKVTILAQGEKENLAKLIEWTKKGPSLARVEKLETNWQKPEEIFSEFEIRY